MLSEAARDFLRAAMICGVSTELFREHDEIVKQMLRELRPLSHVAILELLSGSAPRIRRGPSGSFRFTQAGAIEARELFPPPSIPATILPRRIQGRGTTNVQMRDYAEKNGISLWAGEVGRCSFCGHENDHGLEKGGMRMCQVCFRRGTRFK